MLFFFQDLGSELLLLVVLERVLLREQLRDRLLDRSLSLLPRVRRPLLQLISLILPLQTIIDFVVVGDQRRTVLLLFGVSILLEGQVGVILLLLHKEILCDTLALVHRLSLLASLVGAGRRAGAAAGAVPFTRFPAFLIFTL